MEAPKHRKSRRAKKGAQQPLIPFSRFVKEAERIKDRAIQVLKRDGKHATLLIAHTDTGKEVIGLHVDRPVHEVIAAVVRFRKVRAFVHVGEGWMTRGAAAETLVAPSQSPDREQVLLVTAIHPEGRKGWFIPFAAEGGTVVLGKEMDSDALGLSLAGGIPGALPGKEEER